MNLGTLFIAGGSGSFGRAFIRTILAHDLADRVISLSRNAELRYRLEQECHDPRLLVVPGDVRQPHDLEAAYAGPVDTVIVASAEKHIGTGQSHAHYVRSTNVLGTLNVLDFAARRRAARFVALSTDKACAPVLTQAYGQSKAEMERLLVQANDRDGVRVSLVRYGNVAASSGSVIPLFIQQRQTGRLTVTDRRMSRYWMALSDDGPVRLFQEPGRQPTLSAVGLVLFALEHMAGGEIFVPRIASASVEQIARAIGPDCRIEEIGRRDGEKLHEQLIDVTEALRTWDLGCGVYALLPTTEAVPAYPGAVRVPVGFSYSSDRDIQPVVFEQETTCA